jgi:hypothetical protein
MDSTIYHSFASIIVIYLSENYRLPIHTQLPLLSTISLLIPYLINNVYLIYLLIILIITYFLFINFGISFIFNIKQLFIKETKIIYLYDPISREAFINYIYENKCIKNMNKVTCGSLELQKMMKILSTSWTYNYSESSKDDKNLETKYCLPQDNYTINFVDERNETSGKFTLYTNIDKSYDLSTDPKTIKIVIKYIEIILDNSIYSASEYINKIKSDINGTYLSSLYLINIYSDKNYDKVGKIFSRYGNNLKNKDIYFESFFHPKKKELLDSFDRLENKNNISVDDQNQLGYILYGPPGTGKTSFVFRLANYLNRSIISINMKHCNKQFIIDILRDPSLYYPNLLSSKTIILLDEFDDVVFKLHEKKINKQNSDNNMYDLFCTMIDKDKDKEKDKNNASNSKASNGTELELTLNDLLSILTPVVPINKAIIIATTNHFEEINKLCPELFRPMRLTPVFFNNFDGKIINDITKKYFGESLDINDNYIIKMHNCTFMNLVNIYKDNPNGFNEFKKNIINKL